jgi:dTDP-4-amino-4,6-dideoxygalactose transaminase
VGVPSAVVRAGARPAFVDVEEGSLCMDVGALEGAIGKDTRAVLLTHLNRFVDIEPIVDLFHRKGYEFPLVQDASLAVGSTLGGLRPGVINVGEGGFTVFSFATSKVITGLGGGMLVTNDGSLLERSISMAYQGMNLARIQKLDVFGANLKMNDMSAAIVLSRLAKRGDIFERRRALRLRYDELLAPLVEKGLVRLQEAGDEAVLTHYAALIDGRDELAARLLQKYGVHLAMWHVHHLQDLYKEYGAKLPVSERVADSFAFLPFHTKLTDEDVGRVCGALASELRA